jgi:putative transcriptional regulator
MLIAMPGLREGPFARSVVYLCAHREDGAMGIIVNQRVETVSFADLLVQLDVVDEHEAIRLPASVGAVRVLRGGPVEKGRGFVLHSADFLVGKSTITVGDGICLTATLDILRAIAKGEGPQKAVLALGYAGWSSGQLESEMLANGWLNCPADPDIVASMRPRCRRIQGMPERIALRAAGNEFAARLSAMALRALLEAAASEHP